MPKSFYIIDGHAQIYRAYFAPFRDLTSPTGEPTRATFVFTQMLLNLVESRRPDYLAMVIDAAGDEGVFRKQIDPNYKATRKPRPDDFAPQEARILQICRDAGLPIYFVPAYEADDVLATMAKRLGGQGYETFLVSKDKDLRQVLDEHTRMYDVHTDDVTDAAEHGGQARLHAGRGDRRPDADGRRDRQRPRRARRGREDGREAGQEVRLGRGRARPPGRADAQAAGGVRRPSARRWTSPGSWSRCTRT